LRDRDDGRGRGRRGEVGRGARPEQLAGRARAESIARGDAGPAAEEDALSSPEALQAAMTVLLLAVAALTISKAATD